MNKGLKIAGITLGSLLGAVLVVIGLLVGAVCWVWQPAKLTPVIKELAGNYLNCEYDLGEVELTFWTTFPDFSLRADRLLLINPKEGAPSDTLLAAEHIAARIDVEKMLRNRILEVKEVELTGVSLNPYIAADGSANWDVLVLEEDTTETDSTDGFSLTAIELNDLRATLETRQVWLRDEADTIELRLQDASIRLSAKAPQQAIEGVLQLSAPQISANYKGVNYAQQAAITAQLPFCLTLTDQTSFLSVLTQQASTPLTSTNEEAKSGTTDMDVRLDNAFVQLNDWRIDITGDIRQWSEQTDATPDPSLANTRYDLDLQLKTNTWHISEVLALVPSQLFEMPKDVQADGYVQLDAHVAGTYDSKTWPQVDAHLLLSDAHGSTKALPYRLSDVQAELRTRVDMNKTEPTNVEIVRLNAQTRQSRLTAEGMLKDVFGKMTLNATMDANLHLPDAYYFLPEGAQAEGTAKGIVKAQLALGTMDDLGLKKGVVQADLAVSGLNATLDTIVLNTPKGRLQGKLVYDEKEETKIPCIECSIETERLSVNMGDETHVKAQQANVRAVAKHTNNKENFLLEWRPQLDIRLASASARLEGFEPDIIVPAVKMTYSNRDFVIDTARVEIGKSDFSLSGEVKHIGKWLREKGTLEGELNFLSEHADINELLSYISGLGDDEETSDGENAANTENVAGEENTADETQASEPFMVPKRTDLTLHTYIGTAEAFGQHLAKLGGNIYLKDGVLIIEEVGFICKAARLDLTAMYKTPRKNHIFVGLDYHMTNIDIAELVDMIPQVDEALPMLRSFSGSGNFHLAAETYLNGKYELKPSTTRAVCSIDAQQLTMKDNETFTRIAKLLTFNKRDELLVDSISAEMSMYKQEVQIYPFLVQMDGWKAAVGGRQDVDSESTCDYHISLLKPLWLGVDVTGSLDDLDIRLAPCRYAKEFKPVRTKDVETQGQSLRKLIKQTLTK